MVDALSDEALRMRLFPGIAFRDTDGDRRAWVVGTAHDVWQIVDAYRDIGSVERMVEGGSADEPSIRLALAYYESFPEEIDAAIAETAARSSSYETRFPSSSDAKRQVGRCSRAPAAYSPSVVRESSRPRMLMNTAAKAMPKTSASMKHMLAPARCWSLSADRP